MADELSIKISANTADLKAADRELLVMEKSVGRLNSQLEKNKSGWGSVTSAVTAASTAFLAVNQAVTQYVIAPLQQAVTTFMAFGDSLSKTAQRVGIGVESLGALKFAAEQCGANFDILTDGIKKFQNQLGAAQMGDAGAISKLGNVGLSPDAFAGLTEEDQLMKLADHIKAIGDKSEQTRVAMELFGKAGFKLLPFFQEGSEGIKRLMAEGKDIGAVLGEDAVTSAVEMTDAMNRMKTSATAISNIFIASLAPAITSVLDGVTSLAKIASKFVKDYAPLVTGIGASVAAFTLLKTIMISTTAAMPALVAGFNALKVAMLSNPYLLAGAAIIGGLVAAWSLWNKKIHETEEALRSMNEEAVKHEQAVKAANAADQKLFDRLQELADIEDPLSNDEIREAQMLIDELEGKYGKLGITIDETAGKINGMAQAQAILNREMAQKEIDALEERKKALEAQRGELSKRITENTKKYGHLWDEEALARQGLSLNGPGKRAKKETEELKKEFRSVNDQIRGLVERQNSLRGITTPETGAPAQTREQLKESNIAKRSDMDAAKAELAGMKADTDLMSPMEKSLYELDQKYQQKVANLDKKIAATEKAGGDASSLYAQYGQIEAWRQGEIAKIGQQHTEAQDKAWKEAHPERDRLETRDARIVSAEAQVQSAKQAQANAILSGSGLTEADALLQSAQEALAKTIAEVSGEERRKAQDDLDKATAKLQKAERDGADTKTLNELTAAVRKAQDAYTKANDSYFNAVGSLRQETEEQTAEAVQTTLSSAGTFSAYGMDAAVTSDIPQRTLEAILKILDNTDEMKEEQKNEGVYTK